MADGVPWWLQVIYGALVPLVVAMIVATVQQRQALKAAAPREEAENVALLSGIQTTELKRMAEETSRMAERMKALEDKADKAETAADTAQALAREHADRLNTLERKQRSAVQFIGYLITQWGQMETIPTIPEDLVDDVAPHVKRPRWAKPPAEENP